MTLHLNHQIIGHQLSHCIIISHDDMFLLFIIVVSSLKYNFQSNIFCQLLTDIINFLLGNHFSYVMSYYITLIIKQISFDKTHITGYRRWVIVIVTWQVIISWFMTLLYISKLCPYHLFLYRCDILRWSYILME